MGLNDAQTGMPPCDVEAQCAFKDSMIREFCNSHYISRFATFFIDARAKRSFVESFDILILQTQRAFLKHKDGAKRRRSTCCVPQWFEGEKIKDDHSVMIPPQVHLRRPCYDFYFL